MTEKYRIITDGNVYKVQFKSLLWFWTTIVEHAGYSFSVRDKIFSKEEAEEFIRKQLRPPSQWTEVEMVKGE